MEKATGIKEMKSVRIIHEFKRLVIIRKMIQKAQTQNNVYQERKCTLPPGNFSDPWDTEPFLLWQMWRPLAHTSASQNKICRTLCKEKFSFNMVLRSRKEGKNKNIYYCYQYSRRFRKINHSTDKCWELIRQAVLCFHLLKNIFWTSYCSVISGNALSFTHTSVNSTNHQNHMISWTLWAENVSFAVIFFAFIIYKCK